MTSFDRYLQGEPDAMTGWRSAMIEITDPDVLRQSGQRCHPVVTRSDSPTDDLPGMVFKISTAELAAADAHEVSDYTRVEALLISGRRARVYVKA